MAAEGALNSELSKVLDLDSLSLKEKYNIVLQWNEENWASYNLSNSRLRRLVNSTKFWRPKLQEAVGECNVILTLHSEAPAGYLNPQQIVDDVVRQFPGIEVASYNRFHNPRYLNIDFTTSDMKNRVFNNLTNVGPFEICFLEWAPLSTNLVVRVHWMPRRIPITKIALSLNTYFTHRFVKYETAVHADGKAYGCGAATFVGKLKFGVTMDMVPHIVQIAGLEALITIPNRPPLCLRCDVVGHLANKCKATYCKQCKSMKDKSHECKKSSSYEKSYAQTLKDFETDDVDEEDFIFENTDYVSPQEYYRIAAHAEAKPNEQADQGKIEPTRKFIKVAVNDNNKGLEVKGNEKKSNLPISLAIGKEVEGAAVVKDLTPGVEDMETSQENTTLSPLDEEGKEYITVVKKGSGNKNKNVATKEKMAKTHTIPSTYGTRSSKLNSKAANLFDALVEKPEVTAPIEDPSPS